MKDLTIEQSEITELTIFTDGGCIPNPGNGGWGYSAEDNNKTKYTACGSLAYGATNNSAELIAAIEALRLISSLYLEVANLHIDSKYVLDGRKWSLNWAKNNWDKPDGSGKRPNWELWIDFHTALDDIDESVKLNWHWVKGHSGIDGNEEADRLASLGVLRAKDKDIRTDYWVVPKGETIPDVLTEIYLNAGTPEAPFDADVKVAKKPRVPKPKCIPIHPLISGKRMLWKTNIEQKVGDEYVFCSSTFERKAKKKGEKKDNGYYGKIAPDTHYSVLLTKEPVPVLAKMVETWNGKFKVGHYPIVTELDTLKNAKIYPKVYSDYDSAVVLNGNHLTTIDSDILSMHHTPPKLIFIAEEAYSECLDKIKHYRNGNDNLAVHDITDKIVLDTDKGKQIMNPDFTTSLRYIDADMGKAKCRINIAIDIPTRNTFSALLRDRKTQKISVKLLTWDLTKSGYNFGIIIECGEDICFTYSSVGNYRLLPK